MSCYVILFLFIFFLANQASLMFSASRSSSFRTKQPFFRTASSPRLSMLSPKIMGEYAPMPTDTAFGSHYEDCPG